ncbi:S41 family peptidase [Pseudoduganella namucuonensis]|uniref:Peptidase family S41 n=1 Tax=Pseudoduganella namucuonensis TaxID=1035707 RepID=A0A1I7KNH3_9BURK|nr:S41 family peptidase [Pseudoduganella namucuonensis]SFU98960.1 Peptidase family S41 [Pseudoduganella namucuonensis]
MISYRKALPLALTLFGALSGASAATPDGAAGWAELAQRDLRAAADAIRGRHFGAVAGHLNVTAPLEHGLRAAQAEAALVGDEIAYNRMLARFVSGFGDPHTGLELDLRDTGWTGLMLDRVDGRYRVTWSEANWPVALPPRGAEVRDCDGVWIGTYLQTRVAPYVNHAGEYAHTMSLLAQQVMRQNGLAWAPARCTFVLGDGAVKSYELPLRGVPSDVSQTRLDAATRDRVAVARPVDVYPMPRDMYWVGMPSFGVRDGGKAYEAVYAKLRALKGAKWVVLDLRGNGGGSTAWGQNALAAMYGGGYADRLEKGAGSASYAIADQATIDQFTRFAAHPNFAPMKDYLLKSAAKLAAARQAGRAVDLIDGDDSDPAAIRQPFSLAAPRGPRLAAVIDRNCFSSCQSVLQQIRRVKGAVVLGEATVGYSPYGETTEVKLPSGRAALFVPSGYFLSSTATREPMTPDVAYPGNMGDDAALMRWVGKELAARR